ncbi:hypothetical protein OKA05_25875 [Luteolibacter arcticus]|uniref:EF-hand domain-containing protein n=1 Tax=Luteolibacter arcticus TaxID=1581411 RepID=A0ABT3GR63_9BACT|nr:hypothetical protein [Luteolibacter arcticus]MCW1926014.1 hypothetical protein [Luteolibacter arcticus]
MTNRNSTLGTSVRLAALAITFTGAAFAGAPTEGELAFAAADIAPADGSLNLVEFTTTLEEGTSAQKAKAAFKKADRDKSTSVSLVEFRISIGELTAPTKEELSFIAADTVVDNILTLAEFEATFTGKTAPIEIYKRFLKADAAAPVGLSLEEWTLYKKGKAKGPEGAKYYKFDLADSHPGVDLGEDDKLSIEEFALSFPKGTKEATISAKFAKEDSNEDGFLTRDEWNPGAPKVKPAV